MAEITLPRAGVGSFGRRARSRVPNAFDVPTVAPPRDPGVNITPRVPPGAFGGNIGRAVEQSGRQVFGLGLQMAAADQRVRTREDTVERARDISDYNNTSATELRRLQTEDDLSNAAVSERYGAFLAKLQGQIISDHGGSEDSKAALLVRLEGIRGGYIDRAAGLTVAAQRHRVIATMGESLNILTKNAYQAPGMLSVLFESLDESIDDMAPALTPEDELNLRTSGRQAITLSALNSFLDRGAIREAKAILALPGLDQVLSPADQTNLHRRIAASEQAEAQALFEGRAKLIELETILGRRATPAERARHAGVAPPAGEQTVQQKIVEIEGALDRPLSQSEKSRLVGLAPPQAVSAQGKVIQDRQMFVEEFGPDSEQVQAFDDLASAPEGPPSLTDIGGQRKEFTKLSGVFVNVRNSFNRVTASTSDPSPAGDLSLIFNFMKMLDPGSVVRESEFAQAAATGSFGQRLQAAGVRLLEGKRLSADQREDFVEVSEMLMRVQLRTQFDLEEQFRSLAIRAGINPDDVVIDFVGPFRSGVSGAPPASVGEVSAEPPTPRVRYDLNGERIQ